MLESIDIDIKVVLRMSFFDSNCESFKYFIVIKVFFNDEVLGIRSYYLYEKIAFTCLSFAISDCIKLIKYQMSCFSGIK